MKKIRMSAVAGCMILFVSLLNGCNDNLPTGTDGSVIMPLSVGKKWIGKKTTFDSNGTIIYSYPDTLTITGLVNKDSEAWYEASDGVSYINRKDGLYANDGCECLIARYPALASDTFNTLPHAQVLLPGSCDTCAPVIVEQIIASKVFSIAETVVVPAGTFQAHHYAPIIITPQNAHFVREKHSFYVPDIGPVRIDVYAGGKENGYLSTRWELVKTVL